MSPFDIVPDPHTGLYVLRRPVHIGDRTGWDIVARLTDREVFELGSAAFQALGPERVTAISAEIGREGKDG